jgi:hypothetical protein
VFVQCGIGPHAGWGADEGVVEMARKNGRDMSQVVDMGDVVVPVPNRKCKGYGGDKGYESRDSFKGRQKYSRAGERRRYRRSLTEGYGDIYVSDLV